jgi:misacylated tRNA(Ala) deacylase
MRRDYGSPRPLETHLGAKKSKCDYHVDRPLSEDDLHAIEAAVNAEIVADHPVSDRLVPADEARDRFDLSKVPDGVERIRIVSIGDFDRTSCSGEHVERTSQIERFEIRSAEMRTESRIRIRFRLQDCAKGGR